MTDQAWRAVGRRLMWRRRGAVLGRILLAPVAIVATGALVALFVTGWVKVLPDRWVVAATPVVAAAAGLYLLAAGAGT